MARTANLLSLTAARVAQTVVCSLPPRSIEAVAWVMGSLWWCRDGRRRKRIAENLRTAFGDRYTGAAGRRMARRLFRNMMQVAVELFWFDRLLRTPRQIARRCTLHGDWPDGATPTKPVPGNGGVLFSGHLGNWEFLAPVSRHVIGPMRPVARRIRNPGLDALATHSRGGRDLVIPKHGAYRDLVRSVRAGWWVLIVGDQNAGRGGLWIPFFGLPASSYETPARLSLREGLPLDFIAVLRRPGKDLHFDIHRERLADQAPGQRRPEAVEALTSLAHQRLEHYVRKTPEQYNFLHRRWKDRPAVEPEGAYVPQYDHRSQGKA